MILPIVIYGSSVLREKSFDIDKPDDFSLLAENMTQTLKNAGGVGLAGPQAGILKNLFVIDASIYDNEGIQLS